MIDDSFLEWKKNILIQRLGGSRGLGFKGFSCSRPFAAGDGHA
jgi:hypothetical protein